MERNVKIGDVVASLRRKKRIDQKKLAKDLGITAGYLSQVENGIRNPSPKLLTQIADRLDIPVSAILFEVLQAQDFSSDEDKELFAKAKPMVDQLIALLMEEPKGPVN